MPASQEAAVGELDDFALGSPPEDRSFSCKPCERRDSNSHPRRDWILNTEASGQGQGIPLTDTYRSVLSRTMHEQKYDENYDEVRRWRNEKVNQRTELTAFLPEVGFPVTRTSPRHGTSSASLRSRQRTSPSWRSIDPIQFSSDETP
jgi:hypothetical protein